MPNEIDEHVTILECLGLTIATRAISRPTERNLEVRGVRNCLCYLALDDWTDGEDVDKNVGMMESI